MFSKKVSEICAFLLVVLFLCSCGQQKKNTKPEMNTDTIFTEKGFENVYKNFTESVLHKSVLELNTIVDSTKGIFIIESSGALPSLYWVTDIQTFKSRNGKTFFDCFNVKISEQPVSKEMPVVDCEYSNGTPYSDVGCFMKEISEEDGELDFISSIEGGEVIKKKAEDARKTICMKVLNTYNHVYYFTRKGDTWFLSLIDLRTPCEA